MWEVMQEFWGSCNAYEDAQEGECGFSIFAKVSEKNSSKEDSYWIKAHKIEAQVSQIQVIYVLQCSFTRCSYEEASAAQKATHSSTSTTTSSPWFGIISFHAPASLTSPDLDKKSSEFRLAHMRFYNELKNLFPILNKKAYYEANKSHLGVKLRRFQRWFHSQASDKEAIKAKPLLQILKKSARKGRAQEPPGPPPGPPPKRPRHKPKASQIASKN